MVERLLIGRLGRVRPVQGNTGRTRKSWVLGVCGLVACTALACGSGGSESSSDGGGGSGNASQQGDGGSSGAGNPSSGGSTASGGSSASGGNTASGGTSGGGGQSSAAACKVGDEIYPSGTSGAPDPSSCNTCTCEDGQLVSCTELDCPDTCNAQGGLRGSRCVECGPTDECVTVEHACFPKCEDDDDCQPGEFCVEQICRSLCP